MSISYASTNLIGTGSGSPATIIHGASTSGTIDITGTAGVFAVSLGGQVTVTTSPSAGPTVTWSYSLDGTNFINDPSVQSLPNTASTTTDIGPYEPPAAAQKAKVTITNNDTGSVSITAWAQVDLKSSSNL